MLIQCTEEFDWKLSGLLTINTINAKIYKFGIVSMLNFLNPHLQELLGPNPTIILIILFLTKNTLCIVVDELQKIIP
jgi:hypothetical protein